MDFKAHGKKMLLLGLAALLLIGFLAVEIQDRSSKRELAEILARAEPLERQRDALQQERDRLQRETTENTRVIATEQLLILDLDPRITTELLPLMQELGIPGVLGLCPGNLPGEQGCLSREDFDRLMAAGWECCLVCEAGTDFTAWDGEMTELLQQKGIEKPRAVYFPEKSFDPAWQEEIAACGYTVAIHHGEGRLPLIAGEVTEPLWLTGAHPWNYDGVKTEINELILVRGQHCFTLRFREGVEEYRLSSFQNMLEFVQPFLQAGTLRITGLMQARTIHDPENNGSKAAIEAWEREDKLLADQIAALDQEIQNIYREWKGN